MNEFISRYRDRIRGVITGFDRLVFRGHLALEHETGMKDYLFQQGSPGRTTLRMSQRLASA